MLPLAKDVFGTLGFQVEVQRQLLNWLQGTSTAAGMHSPRWQNNVDRLSDASGSSHRQHSSRQAYWTGAAVAQLPGVSAVLRPAERGNVVNCLAQLACAMLPGQQPECRLSDQRYSLCTHSRNSGAFLPEQAHKVEI